MVGKDSIVAAAAKNSADRGSENTLRVERELMHLSTDNRGRCSLASMASNEDHHGHGDSIPRDLKRLLNLSYDKTRSRRVQSR